MVKTYAVVLFAVVLLVVMAVACGGDKDRSPASNPYPVADEGHVHQAPHGGVLIELGEHFGFLEIVFDTSAGAVTAYVLDEEAEQAVRIAQPSIALIFETPASLAGRTMALAAKANVLTGEKAGDTSEFVLAHPALKAVTGFTGRLVELSVKGQTFNNLPVTSTPLR